LIEHAATLEGKIGDDEKLIYRFETHGGDRVALRYDQTVPLARVIGQDQGKLVFPWRRDAIGQSYRGERPARGRYREFWQADVDIVGSASPVADAEIISTLTDSLSSLGFRDFTTLLNHRQIIGGVARVAGLDEAAAGGIYRAIDKLDKLGPDGVRAELLKAGVSTAAAERILEIILIEGQPADVLEELSDRLADDPRAQEALDNLRAIIANLQAMGVAPERYALAPRLARGLAYYTGSVFESIVRNPPMGSLLGGGRYDELVGMFAGRPIPTVGLAFGIERLHDVMEELGLGPGRRTVSDVFITIFDQDTAGATLQLASELRAAGLNVETALEPRDKLGKQLKYADARGVPLVIVVGPDELANNEVVIKDLRSGDQQRVPRASVVEAIRAGHTGALQ
jgi:histidyl-tRNA synthetase